MDSAFAGRTRQQIWIFAYGALMWRPCFAVAQRRTAVLRGYARSLSVWSALARGTPETPGLAFGLEKLESNNCIGLAYLMESNATEPGLKNLWAMEMHTGIYQPSWVVVETSGGIEKALTFVVEPSHPQYAGTLSFDARVRYIATATGKFGRCRDYLSDAVNVLRSIDSPAPDLEELLRKVDARGN